MLRGSYQGAASPPEPWRRRRTRGRGPGRILPACVAEAGLVHGPDDRAVDGELDDVVDEPRGEEFRRHRPRHVFEGDRERADEDADEYAEPQSFLRPAAAFVAFGIRVREGEK